jgi:hypothetical protein
LKTSSRSALQAAAAIAVVRRRGVEIWGINTIAKAVFGMFGGGFFSSADFREYLRVSKLFGLCD